MIHGMLCTLMIGTVLPEPEPVKHYLVVELLRWETTRWKLERFAEPPVHAEVVATVFVPVVPDGRIHRAEARLAPEPGCRACTSLEAYVTAREDRHDRWNLHVTAIHIDPLGSVGGIDQVFDSRLKSVRLGVGDQEWLGNCNHDQHPGLGFVARLHRDK
ncbi:MAG: hypothetical protein AB7K24_04085 [Gemmataceae bacterium]